MTETILNSFKSILIVCKIFGIWTLNNDGNDRQNIYILVVALSYFGMVSYSVFYILSPLIGELAILYVTDWVQMITAFLVSSLFYYKSFTKKVKLTKAFKSLSNVDEIFLDIQIEFDYKIISQKIIFEIMASLTTILLAGIAIFFILPYDVFDSICNVLVTSILLTLVYLNFILFSNIVHVIFLKYKSINTFLIQIQNECTEVPLIYKAAKCYDEVNEVVMAVNKLFGLTNLVSIGIHSISYKFVRIGC